jgi:uncharacterized protein (TIGR03437 family)
MTNSASLRGAATFGGLGTITGANLTNGRSGASESAARAAGVRVTMEGVEVPVLSFNSERINVYVLPSASNATEGVRAVVVGYQGTIRAASDVRFVAANPGIFTQNNSGTGEAVALLVSGMRYTASPFTATVNSETSVIAIFGTGWRNAASLTVHIGGQAAKTEFVGTTAFAGLDQINVRLPAGARGALPIVLTTSDGTTSRSNVFITVQ